MKERTLTIIKPECVRDHHIGEIIHRFEEAGFEIIGMKMLKLSTTEAEQFYLVHKDRPFYRDLVEFMTSGKVVVMAMEKENAISDLRELIGSTNPDEASEGTIRHAFGKNIRVNCVHASDSVENGLKEVAFFFSERELVACK
ncbi:MAG: nucleoside-diphosphate kinase [Calditrichia bacterium]